MKSKLFIALIVLFYTAQGCLSIQFVHDPNSYEEADISNDCENLIWIIHHAGYQGEELIFPSLSSAMFHLNGYCIAVFDSKEENRMTCCAIGCPTSLYYAARICKGDFERAKKIGWSLYHDRNTTLPDSE